MYDYLTTCHAPCPSEAEFPKQFASMSLDLWHSKDQVLSHGPSIASWSWDHKTCWMRAELWFECAGAERSGKHVRTGIWRIYWNLHIGWYGWYTIRPCLIWYHRIWYQLLRYAIPFRYASPNPSCLELTNSKCKKKTPSCVGFARLAKLPQDILRCIRFLGSWCWWFQHTSYLLWRVAWHQQQHLTMIYHPQWKQWVYDYWSKHNIRGLCAMLIKTGSFIRVRPRSV